MTLSDLGYYDHLESFNTDCKLNGFEIGRVIAEHKERYAIRTSTGEYDAEITGNIRFTATSREDFPAVGDWVAVQTYDSDFAIIHKIAPRFSTIKRQSVGHTAEIQIIATNIDYAFLVQAIDRDYSINRLERYLTICHSSNVSPIVVLTKTDLIPVSQLSEILALVHARIQDVPIIAISNESQDGYDKILAVIEPGKTYCMLGSSGVGKSTLINNLSGKMVMQTGAISESVQRGKHVTSHRQLFVLERGGILIDNPGMREVGIADAGSGLEMTFDMIVRLSPNCKFKDCTHTNEVGCAVLEAVENGSIDRSSYDNYLKMEREKVHFESSVEERRKKDKDFGKFLKNYKKDSKKNKY